MPCQVNQLYTVLGAKILPYLPDDEMVSPFVKELQALIVQLRGVKLECFAGKVLTKTKKVFASMLCIWCALGVDFVMFTCTASLLTK